MGTPLDSAGIPSSLTQRRPAASHLPLFELPPPSHFSAPQLAHKFPPLSGINIQPPSASVSVGNLLTPPPNSGSDSGTNSANLPSQGIPVLPYTPTFWQGAGATPGFTGLTPQWQTTQGMLEKPMFSPVSNGLSRHDLQSQSSGAGIALPPPPYHLAHLPPYAHASQGSSAGHNTQNSAAMNNHMLSSQIRPSSQASPVSPADSVSRATSTPGLYAAMTATATPQPPYGFQSSTPVSQSPHSASAPTSTMSPPLQHGNTPHLHSSSFIKPPYPSYSLPAMPGPVLTNINAPGGQMSLVGNMQAQMLPMHFNSGYAANPQFAYAQARANSPQQAQNQDRPFKCDECPQSFNRNHDLKRHKRIHLAVKPYPCAHCDKSFSRKDALKVSHFEHLTLPKPS